MVYLNVSLFCGGNDSYLSSGSGWSTEIDQVFQGWSCTNYKPYTLSMLFKTTARLEAKYPRIDPPNLCRLCNLEQGGSVQEIPGCLSPTWRDLVWPHGARTLGVLCASAACFFVMWILGACALGTEKMRIWFGICLNLVWISKQQNRIWFDDDLM